MNEVISQINTISHFEKKLNSYVNGLSIIDPKSRVLNHFKNYPLLEVWSEKIMDNQHSMDELTNFLEATQSPIEQIFFLSLYTQLVNSAYTIGLYPHGASTVWKTNPMKKGPLFFEFVIENQVKINDFIVDFRLGLLDDMLKDYCSLKKIIVELDGHDFHEKTKAQAAKDKSRDRKLQSIGYKVIRFTGSEIWHDPFKCVSETLEILRSCNEIHIERPWTLPPSPKRLAIESAIIDY